MEFDRFCVGFLTTKPGVPKRSDADDEAIQDAHMAHLADLHEEGRLLAAGPLSNGHYRGLLLFDTDVGTAERIMSTDPAVVAGWFEVTVIPWMVPAGALLFEATQFPRSMAEVG
jgi:uncharacterized protein YciI